MMNKQIRYLLIAVLVCAAAYYLISRKPWGNTHSERRDFAVTDTASITKLFIADKKGHQVLLEQQTTGDWKVNGMYEADLSKINMLKATLHDVEIMSPVPETQFNNVVAMMASDAHKVEIYSGEELLKTLYVGESTPEGTGTFMMVDGSNRPFITHIPGFVGYLTPRFNPFPVKWKSKRVFDYTMPEIGSITVEYPGKPSESFGVDNQATPVAKDISGKPIPSDPDFVKYYLSAFSNLYMEGYDEDIPKHDVDSIRAGIPYCKVVVSLKSGGKKTLTVFQKAIDQRTKERYDENGNPLTYDRDKYFAFVDDETDMAYIQEYNFGRLFKRASDFSRSAMPAVHAK